MILVFGTTGQVATELRLQAGALDMVALSRAQADLAHPEACVAQIAAHRPQAVINAAAYTAVDRAEEDEALALRVNGDAPGAMAAACAAAGIPFLHVSTDYVFGGQGTAFHRETDPVSPQNAYGRTKLAGEDAVRAAGGAHAILRTSWVFSEHGGNFVKTILRLSESRDEIGVVDDQIGGPTAARDIAATLLGLCDALRVGQTGGTFHYAGAPEASWAEFARAIVSLAGRDMAIKDIPTTDYPTPAARPLNSRLDCSKLASEFGITQPSWRAALSDVVKALT